MDKSKVITVLESLVEEVLNQDELGGCVWCGGSGLEGVYGYCNEDYDCHMTDCPWVSGRRLLETLKNETA